MIIGWFMRLFSSDGGARAKGTTCLPSTFAPHRHRHRQIMHTHKESASELMSSHGSPVVASFFFHSPFLFLYCCMLVSWREQKWSKGKVREKVANQVLFNEDTYTRCLAEVPKVRYNTARYDTVGCDATRQDSG